MKGNIKKVLLGILGVILLLVFRVMKKDYAQYKEKNKQEKSVSVEDVSEVRFSEFLHEISMEINKKCPMVVDKDTRLDNTVVLSNNTIHYNYTMVNLEKENIDLKALEKNYTPILLENVKTNPGLKTFRDRNVTLSYYYKDKNGNFLLSYKATPELYK